MDSAIFPFMAKEMAFYHCRVGYKGEQGDTKELLINRKVLENNVHGIDQNFRNDGIQNGSPKENDSTLGSAPVGRIMATVSLVSFGSSTFGLGAVNMGMPPAAVSVLAGTVVFTVHTVKLVTSINLLAFALFESDTVEEHLNDSCEKGVDGSAHAHRRLGRDRGNSLSNEVGQGYNREEPGAKEKRRSREESFEVENPVKHEPVDDDEEYNNHQVDKENIGSVNGILPVSGSNRTVCAKKNRRAWTTIFADISNIGLERQCQRVSSEMVEQQDRGLAHGDPENQEPTNTRYEQKRGRDQAVEEDEEDNTANIPLATAKQSSLVLRQLSAFATSATTKKALGLAGL
ncbi:hypothetical protein HG530_011345 [Fusarium avenaceum]|nr:hypothetical protein HG530_011345 [Fusarium avenaceum]